MQRDLTQFLESVKNKNFDTWKERQIETSVVIPLLESLGWDTTVEAEVKVQSSIGKGRSDIELRSKGLCNVVIEAKKGNASLTKNLEFERQLMSYAGGVNEGEPSDLAVLTNGKDWQFYLPSIDGGYNKKRFYGMDISKQSSKEIILIFNELLLKVNIINGNSFKKALSINEQRFKSEVAKHEKETKEVVPTKIIEEYQNYIPIGGDFTKKSIESYYFSDSIYNVHSWKGLLVGILDNMHTLYKKDFDRILGVTGGNGRIFFSQDQDDVSVPLKIKDTNIYVETKLSANNIARLCSDIIYEFGYSDNDLKIKTSSENIKGTISQPISITAKSIDTDTINSQKSKMAAQPIDTDTINSQKSKMAAQPIDTSIDMVISEKNKRERYGEYASTIQKILPDIKNMISSAKDKEVKFKIMDIAKDLGNDFIDKNPTTIYRGLKYALFKEGIVVGLATYSGEKLLTMRCVTQDDKLPESLVKISEEKQDINIKIDHNAIAKNVDDTKQNKGAAPEKEGFKRERYGKYAQAISSHIVWIKERITSSQDGIVTIKVSELVKKMGPDFEKKSDTTIWWALKYVLFYEWIVVEMGAQEDGEKVLKMRTRKSEDELPPSLAKLDNKEDTS